jgi:hypothetical protein
MTLDELWDRIAGHEGQTFRLVRGREFTYEVKPGAVYPSTVNRHMSRGQFEKALARTPLTKTTDVHDLQVPSYLFALMTDPRIGANRG